MLVAAFTTITGSHLALIQPRAAVRLGFQTADGPWELRKLARTNLLAGADVLAVDPLVVVRLGLLGQRHRLGVGGRQVGVEVQPVGLHHIALLVVLLLLILELFLFVLVFSDFNCT